MGRSIRITSPASGCIPRPNWGRIAGEISADRKRDRWRDGGETTVAECRIRGRGKGRVAIREGANEERGRWAQGESEQRRTKTRGRQEHRARAEGGGRRARGEGAMEGQLAAISQLRQQPLVDTFLR